MYLLGNTLTKALATVAALLTVLAGLPYVRCVCPDGRVKFFCSGPSHTACCCVAPQSAVEGESASASCCSRSDDSHADQPDRNPDPSGEDGSVGRKTCGCERALAPDSHSSVAEEVGKVEPVGTTVENWEVLPVVSVTAFFPRRVSACLLPQPDRVVRFCHFTC